MRFNLTLIKMKLFYSVIITFILIFISSIGAENGNSLARVHDLHHAAALGQLKIVENLISEKGTSINGKDKSGNTPLYWAAINEQPEVVAFLVAKGADINSQSKKGITSLHEIAFRGNLFMAKLLIQLGADVNQANAEGLSPLHFAIINGDVEMVKLLIRKGARVKPQNIGDYSALHIAAAYGRKQIALSLIALGCDINAKDKSGRSALIIAITNQERDTVEELIQHGADINQGDNYGNYPLLLAAQLGDMESAKLLMSAGSEVLPSAIDHESEEMTPLYYVKMFRQKNHKNLGRLLKSYSPELNHLEKEHIHLKRLGHAWKIDGEYTVIPKIDGYPTMTLRILGGRSSLFYRAMAKGTLNYINSCKSNKNAHFFGNLQEMLSFGEDLYDHSANELFIRIREDKPTPIHVGWNRETHQVELLIWENVLVLSNRGIGSRKPLEVFEFNKNLLTVEVIQKILDLDNLSKEEFEKVLFLDIAKQLQLKKGTFSQFIEDNSTLSLQRVDNCAWDSAEGIVYAFFLIDCLKHNSNEEKFSDKEQEMKILIKDQQQKFSKWLSFQQLDVFERYVIHHNEEATPYFANEELISKIIEKIDEDKSFCIDKCLESKVRKIKTELHGSSSI
jgi:ankyrin repeat protein